MPFVFLPKGGTRVFPTLQMSPFLDAIYRCIWRAASAYRSTLIDSRAITPTLFMLEYSFNDATSVNLFRLRGKVTRLKKKRVEHATNQAEGLKLKEVIAFKLP